MIIADRRLRTGERPGRAIFRVWLALCVILLAVSSQYIAQGRMPDPDDVLRLVQVRDLIAGQGWYDLHQYRITPPEGVLMHWSRLADAPLWLFISLLAPLIGQAMAEQVTMIAVPLLVMGLILVAVGRLAWRLFDIETTYFACFAVGLCSPIVVQIQPLRIDHHSYQILAVAMALWAISWRSQLKGGAAAGLAMAAGTMISLEIVPMATAFGGVLALRWFRDPELRWWLVAYMQTFALGLVAIFALTRGMADLAVHCDAISPPHLGFFLVTALGTGAIAALPQLTRPMLFIMFCLAGTLGLGFVALTGAQCIGTPLGRLDPLVESHWYQAVREGLPVWRQELHRAIPAVVQILVALAASLFLMARSRDWLKVWWLEYSLLLAAAIVAGMLTFRSMAFPAIIGVIPLGWLVNQIFRTVRRTDRPAPRLGYILAIFAIVAPSAPALVAERMLQGDEGSAPKRLRESDCALQVNAQLLDRLAPSVLFTPLDMGPSILLESHHSVVASAHHRAEMAMRDVIVAFKGTPTTARPIISRYRADYVVMCTDLSEPANFAAMGGEPSLAAHLLKNDPPPWLEPVDIGGPPQFRVWKVVQR